MYDCWIVRLYRALLGDRTVAGEEQVTPLNKDSYSLGSLVSYIATHLNSFCKKLKLFEHMNTQEVIKETYSSGTSGNFHGQTSLQKLTPALWNFVLCDIIKKSFEWKDYREQIFIEQNNFLGYSDSFLNTTRCCLFRGVMEEGRGYLIGV